MDGMRDPKGRWIPSDWQDFTPAETDRNRYMVRGGEVICRYDIPGYFSDPFIAECLQAYDLYEKFGWPYSQNWAEQPAVLFDVINAIKTQMRRTHG